MCCSSYQFANNQSPWCHEPIPKTKHMQNATSTACTHWRKRGTLIPVITELPATLPHCEVSQVNPKKPSRQHESILEGLEVPAARWADYVTDIAIVVVHHYFEYSHEGLDCVLRAVIQVVSIKRMQPPRGQRFVPRRKPLQPKKENIKPDRSPFSS